MGKEIRSLNDRNGEIDEGNDSQVETLINKLNQKGYDLVEANQQLTQDIIDNPKAGKFPMF